MAHKFNVKNKSKLDNPMRRAMLPVDEVLDKIGLRESDIIADIGCGIGYFTVPMAKATGNNGMVYAIDIEPDMLNEIHELIQRMDLKNISPIQSLEYDFILNDNLVTLAFLCTVLHEVDDKEKMLKEASRILKANGKIAIIDWIKKESDYGPPMEHRIDTESVKELLLITGFHNIEILKFNEHFYIITAAM